MTARFAAADARGGDARDAAAGGGIPFPQSSPSRRAAAQAAAGAAAQAQQQGAAAAEPGALPSIKHLFGLERGDNLQSVRAPYPGAPLHSSFAFAQPAPRAAPSDAGASMEAPAAWGPRRERHYSSTGSSGSSAASASMAAAAPPTSSLRGSPRSGGRTRHASSAGAGATHAAPGAARPMSPLSHAVSLSDPSPMFLVPPSPVRGADAHDARPSPPPPATARGKRSIAQTERAGGSPSPGVSSSSGASSTGRRRHTLGALDEPAGLPSAAVEGPAEPTPRRGVHGTPRAVGRAAAAAAEAGSAIRRRGSTPDSPTTPTAHMNAAGRRLPPSARHMYEAGTAYSGSLPSLSSSASTTSFTSDGEARTRNGSLEGGSNVRAGPPFMPPANASGYGPSSYGHHQHSQSWSASPHSDSTAAMYSPRGAASVGWHSRTSTLDSIDAAHATSAPYGAPHAFPAPSRGDSARPRHHSLWQYGGTAGPAGGAPMLHARTYSEQQRLGDGFSDGLASLADAAADVSVLPPRQRAQTLGTSLNAGASRPIAPLPAGAAYGRRDEEMDVDEVPHGAAMQKSTSTDGAAASLAALASRPTSSAGASASGVLASAHGGGMIAAGGAKYECSWCGKRFSRPSSLRIHHHSHTGEKPFVCHEPGCGRSFSVQSNLRRHQKGHHQGSTGSAGLPEHAEEDARVRTMSNASASSSGSLARANSSAGMYSTPSQGGSSSAGSMGAPTSAAYYGASAPAATSFGGGSAAGASAASLLSPRGGSRDGHPPLSRSAFEPGSRAFVSPAWCSNAFANAAQQQQQYAHGATAPSLGARYQLARERRFSGSSVDADEDDGAAALAALRASGGPNASPTSQAHARMQAFALPAKAPPLSGARILPRSDSSGTLPPSSDDAEDALAEAEAERDAATSGMRRGFATLLNGDDS